METKKCPKCGQEKQLDHFSKDSTKRDGLQIVCKACQKLISAAYRAKNPEYFAKKSKNRYHTIGKLQNKERYQGARDAYLARRDASLKTPRGRLYGIFSAARDRARRSGLDCTITLEWTLEQWNAQSGRCAVTGIELTTERNPVGVRFSNPFNPSLDKINADLGYTQENTRLVCVMVNLALNRFGDDSFDKMCRAYILKKETEMKIKDAAWELAEKVAA